MTDDDTARFGEQPLAQTVEAAGALRRLTGLLLGMEHEHPTVDVILDQCARWESELAAAVPQDPAPRMGEDGPERRVYLNHAFDVGSFNPCFPEYRMERFDDRTAEGTVSFPLSYEGPPGLVHGGFLAVFFDCVTQHQNCATQLTGKTRSMTVTYQRPTPVLTELRFDIDRVRDDRAITSTAHLTLDGVVLCTGEVRTVARRPDQLSVYEFGMRRPRELER